MRFGTVGSWFVVAWACVPPPGQPNFDTDVDTDVDETGTHTDACDDGPADTWWPDLDGDGFGDRDAAGVTSCEPVVGWVTEATDCDDGDPTIHPGAPEPCGEVDRNCDGALTTCALSGDVPLGDAVFTVRGTRGEGALLSPAGGVLGGDGAAIGIGTGPPDPHDPLGVRGWLAGFVGGSPVRWEIAFTMVGNHSRIAGAGDLTGDGVPDLFAATFCYYEHLTTPCEDYSFDSDAHGLAYLVPGPITGDLQLPSTPGGRSSAIRFEAPDRSCPGVDAVAVDGSLAVSGCGEGDHGVVWIVDPVSDLEAIVLADSPGVLTGSADDNGLGWRMAAGDLDGDGREDLVIGNFGDAPNTMGAVVVDAPDLRQQAAIRAVGVSFSTDRLPASASGAAVAVADVDGDGLLDAILGTRADQGPVGTVWLLPRGGGPGSSVDLVDAGTDRIDGLGTHGSFAVSVAGAGDVDGDGFDDLLVGADEAGLGGGAVWLLSGADLRGAATLNQLEPLATFAGTAEQRLGYAVLGPGDLDGDGWPDVVLGTRTPQEGKKAASDVVAYGFLGGITP